MKKFKKALKIIGIVLLSLLGVFILSYMIYGCSVVNYSDLPISQFYNNFYYSSDFNDFVFISSNIKNSFYYINNEYFFPDSVSYEDNVFTFSNEDSSFYFLAVNKTQFYSYQFRESFYYVEVIL